MGLADQASNIGVTDAVAGGREAENQTTRGRKLRPWARCLTDVSSRNNDRGEICPTCGFDRQARSE